MAVDARARVRRPARSESSFSVSVLPSAVTPSPGLGGAGGEERRAAVRRPGHYRQVRRQAEPIRRPPASTIPSRLPGSRHPPAAGRVGTPSPSSQAGHLAPHPGPSQSRARCCRPTARTGRRAARRSSRPVQGERGLPRRLGVRDQPRGGRGGAVRPALGRRRLPSSWPRRLPPRRRCTSARAPAAAPPRPPAAACPRSRRRPAPRSGRAWLAATSASASAVARHHASGSCVTLGPATVEAGSRRAAWATSVPSGPTAIARTPEVPTSIPTASSRMDPPRRPWRLDQPRISGAA